MQLDERLQEDLARVASMSSCGSLGGEEEITVSVTLAGEGLVLEMQALASDCVHETIMRGCQDPRFWHHHRISSVLFGGEPVSVEESFEDVGIEDRGRITVWTMEEDMAP